MTNSTDPQPPAAPEPPPTISLESDYDGAIIGHTVSPATGPRFVYSLNALARMRSVRQNRSLEVAREDVWGMVCDVTRQHGDAAPLFVDDEVSRPGISKEKSRIIVPGNFRPGRN